MSTPSAKRRRVEAANAVLRKPFHSPLIRRPDGQGAAGPSSKTPEPASVRRIVNEEEEGTPDSPLGRGKGSSLRSSRSLGSLRRRPETRPQPQSEAQLSPPRKHKASSSLSKGPRTQLLTKRPSKSDLRHGSNPLLALVAAHGREQDGVIKDLDSQLETARQAKLIEAQSERKRPGEPVDQELRDLILKWMGASRQAAEEVFGLVKERVDSAGGPKAWREMQHRQSAFYQGFDEEDLAGLKAKGDVKGGYEDGDDEDGPFGMSRADLEEDDAPAEDDEPEFNMLAMLQSLNIDPSLLGYNAAEDRWSN